MPGSVRKDRIRTACLALLRGEAPENVRMKDVAAASGSSTPLVALHFGSLENLLVETSLTAIDQIVARLAAKLEADWPAGPDAPRLRYEDAAALVTSADAWEMRVFGYATPRMSGPQSARFVSIITPFLGHLAQRTQVLEYCAGEDAILMLELFSSYMAHGARQVGDGRLKPDQLARRLVRLANLIRSETNR